MSKAERAGVVSRRRFGAAAFLGAIAFIAFGLIYYLNVKGNWAYSWGLALAIGVVVFAIAAFVWPRK
jgi:hypothetical protein